MAWLGVDEQLVLERRSLLIMKEDARYEYRHGIPRAKLIHMPDGTVRGVWCPVVVVGLERKGGLACGWREKRRRRRRRRRKKKMMMVVVVVVMNKEKHLEAVVRRVQ